MTLPSLREILNQGKLDKRARITIIPLFAPYTGAVASFQSPPLDGCKFRADRVYLRPANRCWSGWAMPPRYKETESVQGMLEVKADVLVIGGGLAGCWAAIRARQAGAQVILADKGPAGWTGQSKFSSGDIKCLLPDDDLQAWVEEIVIGGDYLNDQRWLELILTETYPLVEQMESFGCRFERKDGKLQRELGRGRITRQAVLNAGQMMKAMRQAAGSLGVRILDRTFVTRILTEGGRVTGVLGVNTQDGSPCVCAAPAVVLAAGGCGFRSLYYGYQFSTGDGYALAYHAGAHLMNFEFAGWNSCHKDFPTTGMSRLVAFGGVFRNSLGEAFMDRYDPVRKSRTQLTNLAIGMAKETRAGNGPIYFDLTSMSPEHYELSRKLIPWNFMLLEKAGLDPRSEKMEWVPAFLGPGATSSGVKTDFNFSSNVGGLYACGDAWASTLNGAGIGFGGLNLALCAVSGYRAGENAAGYAAQQAWTGPDRESVHEAVTSSIAAAEREKGVDSEELLLRLQKAIVPYDVLILRSEDGLRKALRKVEAIQDEMRNVRAPDPHELIKVIELENMLLVAEMILRSARKRTETRGLHYREDYPQRDNTNWLKWIGLNKENDRMGLWLEPIPGDAFKFILP